MFKFPLAIMKIYEAMLMDSDIEGVNEIFEALGNEGAKNPSGPAFQTEFIIEQARKIDIEAEWIYELRQEYKNQMIKNKE